MQIYQQICRLFWKNWYHCYRLIYLCFTKKKSASDTQETASIRSTAMTENQARKFSNVITFMQMTSDACEGLISIIIVNKYDRFSRNMCENLSVTNELEERRDKTFQEIWKLNIQHREYVNLVGSLKFKEEI